MPIAQKLQDYKQLVKFTLSFTVVFSSIICYLLHPSVSFNWAMVGWLFIAGMLVTSSANAINQIIEKNTDALMKRTAKRPIASGRMSVSEASVFATAAGITGTLIMWNYFNGAAAALSALSLLIYAFVYTPLKKVNSIAVLVGGIPGALPCLIGWVAGISTSSGTTSWLGGWVLFAIQFVWQFPHFWAIAWLAHKDYEGAGFKLLPSRQGQTKYSAQQALIYAILMVPIGLLPYLLTYLGQANLSTTPSLYIVLLSNIYMVLQCYRLLTDGNDKAARRVMFTSYIYLPVVLLALLLFKS